MPPRGCSGRLRHAAARGAWAYRAPLTRGPPKRGGGSAGSCPPRGGSAARACAAPQPRHATAGRRARLLSRSPCPSPHSLLMASLSLPLHCNASFSSCCSILIPPRLLLPPPACRARFLLGEASLTQIPVFAPTSSFLHVLRRAVWFFPASCAPVSRAGKCRTGLCI